MCRPGFRSVLDANILSMPEVVICDLKYPADADAQAVWKSE